MLIAIFAIALLSTLVVGMLQINSEEIQIARNQICAAHALATAQAGLNDAFSELREDSTWSDGFTAKSFNNGSYDVTVTGSVPVLSIESIGTSQQGFAAKVHADITISNSPPHIIRIDDFKVNQ